MARTRAGSQRVATAMERLVRELKVKALVMVAPPRTLADLRGAFHSDVSVGSSAGIGKDLTKHPIHEIKQHLMD